MEKFEGVTVSPGYAEGKIMYFCARQVDFSTETIENWAIDDELTLLDEGIHEVEHSLRENIEHLQSEGRLEEVTLTEARILLLYDIIETGECRKLISGKNYSARHAVLDAATRIRLRFENLDDDFMRERVYDVKQVSEMLLSTLNGEQRTFPKLNEPTIIVADELIPEGTLCFERPNILGIVIKNSTYNSHASILARLWNIPALAEIEIDQAWDGHNAVIDANNNALYIDLEK